jgi:hypothetical protein
VRLAAAPRRVPRTLWLYLVFGQWLMQLGALTVGACSRALAFVLPHGPDDPPIWLASFIIAIGCFPLFAVASLRAHRSLAMLARGREEPDGKLHDPVEELPAMPIDALPGNPIISDTGELVARQKFVPLLLVLPLAAVGGIVALIAY